MTEFTIQRRKLQTRYFTEDLGNGIGLDVLFIQGGTFLMGSPPDELERRSNEDPQHLVTISTFAMGRYPVTQAQWRAIASLPKVNRDLNPDPSHFKGEHHPVERVSWWNAVECCDRLSRKTGREYRLPTEAEWEYACRAGTTTPFYFGETLTTDIANYRGTDEETYGWSGSYGRGAKGEYRQATTPVDQFGIANAFGLCEMHGNVWEWCLDHWHHNYNDPPLDGSVWLTEDENARRVVRGGSWYGPPRYCRSASRDYYSSPDLAYSAVGLRLVCVFPRILQ